MEELHAKGKKVVMVGDGVNDILALANADIGIVMGSGSDIAIEVSDVVLMDSSLKSLEDAFKISRTTFGLVKQNLGISLVYNAITIPLAMAGYVIPLVAAISNEREFPFGGGKFDAYPLAMEEKLKDSDG